MFKIVSLASKFGSTCSFTGWDLLEIGSLHPYKGGLVGGGGGKKRRR